MLNGGEGNVNTPGLHNENEVIMVPYNRVHSLAWDLAAGARLKKIRLNKGMTRPQLEKMSRGTFSKDTVKSLEMGRVQSVSREIIDCILALLESDITNIFPSVSVKNFPPSA